MEFCLILIVFLIALDRVSSSIFIFFLVELFFSVVYLFWLIFGFDFLFLIFFSGKVGLFPFWFWVFRVFDSNSLRLCLVIITFFKSIVVVLLCFFSFSGFTLFLVLNLFCVFLLFFSVLDLKIYFCFFSIISGGWLFFLSINEVFFLFFLSYFFFLWCIFIVSLVFEVCLSFIWVFFYLGFPFLFSFFVKVFGLFDQMGFSFVCCCLLFVVGVFLFTFFFFGFFNSFVFYGLSILLFVSCFSFYF